MLGLAAIPWGWQWAQESAREITAEHSERQRPRRYKGDTDDCGPPVTRGNLETGATLAREYLQLAQRQDGHLHLALDWQAAETTPLDQPTAQAMITWAMAATHDPHLTDAVDRALARWLALTTRHDDRILIQYPDTERGQITTLALVGLAIQERRATAPAPADPDALDSHLAGTIAAVQHAAQAGHFALFTRPETGRQYGPPSPVGDALAVLLLVRQAASDPALAPLATASADSAWQSWFVARRAVRLRHPQLQQFAPWGLRLATALHHAGLDPDGTWKERAITLTTWMIDDDELALSTVAHAHSVASMLEVLTLPDLDPPFEQKLRCVLRMAIRRGLGLQAGHPLAMWNARRVPDTVAPARGGVLSHRQSNETSSAATAHLLHATTAAGQHFLD